MDMQADVAAVSPDNWITEANAKFFKSYRGVSVTRNVELGSQLVFRHLQRSFEFVSRNLHFISVIGRAELGPKHFDKIEKAEEVVEKTLENGLKKINAKIAQAETVIRDSGTSLPSKYNKPRTLEAPLTTPGSRVYIDLHERADYFYELNSRLWVLGEITAKARHENETALRGDLSGVSQGIGAQFQVIRKAINRIKEERDAEVAKKTADIAAKKNTGEDKAKPSEAPKATTTEQPAAEVAVAA